MSEPTSRKLLEKQQRRMAEEAKEAERKSAARRRNLITFVTIAVVVTLVVVLVLKDRGAKDAPVGVAAGEAGCTAVETPEEQGQDHIEEGTQHPPYSSNPPTSGPHYGSPADAGFYETPMAQETVVHNLEHGQIVIWYRPDAEQDVLDQIEDVTRDEAVATLAVPFSEIEEPYDLVLTAWGALQRCENVSQVVIDDFRAEYQGRGPENVGVPVFRAE
ncbi:MAG TPA: DUF3105 domain-containing protein [Actinomycetota bacterium]|nr:DUF3105 domain-containing protein [Actinomycetota bacterium]